jgi:hypothetical protein
LARHCVTSGQITSGTMTRPGSALITWYNDAEMDLRSNGPLPVAANVSTAPRLKMSLGGPTRSPRACSGDMKPCVPTIAPSPAGSSDSTGTAIPKSTIPRAVTPQDHVGRLQVPVHDSRRVDIPHSLGQRGTQG